MFINLWWYILHIKIFKAIVMINNMLFNEKISVIAPANNEEDVVEEFVKKTYETFRKYQLKGEIVVVDDGSTDKTLEILKRLQEEIRILRIISYKRNKGLTYAFTKGIKNSKYDYIVFLPSDLESNPLEDIPKLLGGINEGYDMVIGYRDKKKRGGLIKTISSNLFNLITSIFFKGKFKDVGWVKAFKKEIYYNIEVLRSDWHRFLVILAANEGYRIKEIKTNFYPRRKGRSHFGRFGIGRAYGGLIDLIVIKFLISFSKKPMRIFGILGGVSIFLGFIVSLYVIYLDIMLGSIVERVPLILLGVLLILTGFNLFSLGFLAELIVSINERKEIKN
ncbi:glycosyltransferase [Candidatus Pacearchaeota archaeon]|nr:glycosyltransferase [Candidatus Pacearchaeota archaeon]